jgi:hypothetical protein
MAELHDAPILKEHVTDFIAKNGEEVVKTKSWKHLHKTRPDLVDKFICVITNKLAAKNSGDGKIARGRKRGRARTPTPN